MSQTLNRILKHLPIDSFTDYPIGIMAQDNSSNLADAAHDFIKVIDKYEESGHKYSLIDRSNFYSDTKHCQLVIATNDLRAYACLILQKGVIFD